jgi:hypothetical protein
VHPVALKAGKRDAEENATQKKATQPTSRNPTTARDGDTKGRRAHCPQWRRQTGKWDAEENATQKKVTQPTSRNPTTARDGDIEGRGAHYSVAPGAGEEKRYPEEGHPTNFKEPHNPAHHTAPQPSTPFLLSYLRNRSWSPACGGLPRRDAMSAASLGLNTS